MAFYLNEASGEYFTVPNETDYDFINAMSVAFFARHEGLWVNTWEAVVSKGDDAWRLSRYSGGGNRGIHWATEGTSGGGGGSLNWDGTFDDGEWHGVVCTFQSGTPGRKRIILDGVVVAEDLAVTGTILNQADVVWIGNNADSTAREFGGWLDDLRLYNRELSVAEAQGFCTMRGGDGNYVGLVSRWTGSNGPPGTVITSLLDDTGLNNGSPVATPEYAEAPYSGRRRRAG